MRMLKLFIFITCLSTPAGAQIAIEADTVFTVSGGPILNGVVLVKNGKIEAVGRTTDVKIPASYKKYRANVITPGLVDARSMVGLSGAMNVPTDQDQLEKSSPLQPDLRAIDAYNPEDSLVSYLRSWGVTTLHTGHGVGALVSGQTMVVKTKPGFAEEVVVLPLAMLAMTFGPDVGENFPSPGTKSKQVAMLRTEMIKAQAYQKKMGEKDESKRPARDLKLEMLLKLMNGEVKGLISANRATDILSAIRLAKEFGFKLVLEGCAEGY
ncbi:MAG TPA: hypothetical protein VD816_18800, partial [Ohtaekwangia sp.]|nr:hypothetical protein [Ohtaekwangia sp.]